MTHRRDHFSTTEAACLATACLAAAEGAETGEALRRTLFRTALAWSPDEGPVTERAVNKAIEEAVVVPVAHADARLDEGAVLYLVGMRTLEGVTLSRDAKRRLYGSLRALPRRSVTWRCPIADGLYFAPGARLGRWRALLHAYVGDRLRHVSADPEIMGGVPVIRGTRIPVHSVLARLEGGDSVGDLVADYPELAPAAFEAAAIHARTHPRRGRPVRRYR